MCVNPLQIKVVSRTFGLTRFVDAPCGRCIECLKRRQNDWKLRLIHESSSWNNLFFFTLTYSNKTLPCRVDYSDLALPEQYAEFYGSYLECKDFATDEMSIRSTARKDHVQRFLKRLRTNYERSTGVPLKMKYFICAEYGPNPNGTKRPHYHGLIMTNASYFDLLPEFNAWRDDFGRMEFKQVGFGREQSSKVANYVSKYCAKGCFESRLDDINAGFIEKAWYIMSKNIGLNWLEENKDHWLNKVPTCRTIEGDWSFHDVEKFFLSGSDRAHLCASEIDSLLDDFFIMDGESSYSYKMPRYYRERILCVRKSFINSQTLSVNGKPVYDIRLCQSELFPIQQHFAYYCAPFQITYKSFIREDKRYVSENFLSCAFAYRLSLRVLARDCENRVAQRETYYSDANGFFHSTYEDSKRLAREMRAKVAESSLRDFYTSNMWKHREFDYESDGELDYNLFNI